MTQVNWDKLEKAFGMMGSAHPGEALNARDVTAALLHEGGLSWADLKDIIRRRAGSEKIWGADSWSPRDATHAPPQIVIDLQNQLHHAFAEVNRLRGAMHERERQNNSEREVERRKSDAAVHELRARNQQLEILLRGKTDKLEEATGCMLEMAKSNRELTLENRQLRGLPRETVVPEPEPEPEPQPKPEPVEAIVPERGPPALREIVGYNYDGRISMRLLNALRQAGLMRLGEVAQWSTAELRRLPNLGRKSYQELWELLVAEGLWDALDPARQWPG